MPVNKTLCQGAGRAGDIVDVVMERDEEGARWRLRRSLRRSWRRARRRRSGGTGWRSRTRKRWRIRFRAKQEETRKRRLAKVMQVLKTGAKWTGVWHFAIQVRSNRPPSRKEREKGGAPPVSFSAKPVSASSSRSRRFRFPGIGGWRRCRRLRLRGRSGRWLELFLPGPGLGFWSCRLRLARLSPAGRACLSFRRPGRRRRRLRRSAAAWVTSAGE